MARFGGMEILQCPVCELRFRNAPELDSHLALEHPKFRAEQKEREASPIGDPQRPRAKRHRPQA